ncbi:Zinc finger MYND domain-containing protein 10 [Chlorella vulgaris]
MDALVARAQSGAAGPQASSQVALTASEAERVVKCLRTFDIEQYGTPAWLEQHDVLQQLNLQAHINAQAHSDEFVKEAFVSHDRITVLVRELLVAEVWRERVLPLLERHLAEGLDIVTAYQLLYQEAALANLIEVLLYHRDACEAASEEALVELCDWCSRCIHYLATQAHQQAEQPGCAPQRTAVELAGRPPLEEFRERAAEVRFGAALCALAILRYVTDHAPQLSLSVLTRIYPSAQPECQPSRAAVHGSVQQVSSNDTAMALLPLLDQPPWVRRSKAGATEKFVGGSWRAVEPRERHRLTQHDGQVWLLLHNLLADGAARSKMDMTDARCEGLLRLKRHFNEVLLDQLPPLRNLQRVIDELAFGVNNSQQSAATPSRLIVEQVPTIRARLLHRNDWRALAEAQAAGQFGAEAQRLSQGRMERLMQSFDLMCGMEEQGASQNEASGGLPDTVKVDAYRQAKPGVWEWWSTYSLQVNKELVPEAVSSSTSSTTGASKHASTARAGPGSLSSGGADENHPRQASSASGGSGGPPPVAVVKGKRYRLLPMSQNLQRALPADGKITVLYGGHTCEAQLSLPASETRDTSALTPAIWVTVGGLAAGGLALQLKLKRLDKPCERDKAAGVWYPYVPIGGAVTVADACSPDGSHPAEREMLLVKRAAALRFGVVAPLVTSLQLQIAGSKAATVAAAVTAAANDILSLLGRRYGRCYSSDRQPEPSHVLDSKGDIVGSYTPVTKRLWTQRYKWTDDKLAAASPRDPLLQQQLVKSPCPTVISYPFTNDSILREHYRNPWGSVRLGRILEDLDSLAGFVAYEHCDDGDPTTRPPLLVTATVEEISLRSSQLSLDEEMRMSGRVVWTGKSSIDIRMELEQAGQRQLTALFTFVARDPLTGTAFAINRVQPESEQDKQLFEQRQQINEQHKAARKQQQRSGGVKLCRASAEAQQWAEHLLALAKTKRDLPALADPNLLLMDDTSLENTFTCQPQQRNMHGRIFGGFLMRRAFELAHSTAYLFSGCRPRTVEVDRITFQRPVSVGDLITFRAWVTRAWVLPDTPGQGLVHLQVEASVTQPEKLASEVTNTFNFTFQVELRRDAAGDYVAPKQVLPGTEQQALASFAAAAARAVATVVAEVCDLDSSSTSLPGLLDQIDCVYTRLECAMADSPDAETVTAVDRAIEAGARRVGPLGARLAAVARRGNAATVADVEEQFAAACALSYYLGSIASKYRLVRATPALCGCVTLPLQCGHALMARPAVSGSEITRDMAGILCTQTHLLIRLLSLGCMDHHTGAKHFPAQLAAPELVLAWLSAAVSTVLALRGHDRGPSPLKHINIAGVVSTMADKKLLQPHASALQRAAGLKDNLVQVLTPALHAAAVAIQLPPDRRPQDLSWMAIADLVSALTSPALSSAFLAQLASSSSGISTAALCVLQSTSQLIAAAPASCPEELTTRFASLWFNLPALLSTTCRFVGDGIQCWQQQQQQPQRSAAVPDAQRRKAVWLLLRALPHLPTALRVLADCCRQDADGSATAGGMLDMCRYTLSLMNQMKVQKPRQPADYSSFAADDLRLYHTLDSLAGVPAWCSAGTALQRAAHGDTDSYGTATRRVLCELLVAVVSYNIVNEIAAYCGNMASGVSCSAADGSAAGEALWQLHTALLLVRQRMRLLKGPPPVLQDMPTASEGEHLLAMSVAQAEAVLAAANLSQLAPADRHVAAALLSAVRHGPAALVGSPPVQQALEGLAERLGVAARVGYTSAGTSTCEAVHSTDLSRAGSDSAASLHTEVVKMLHREPQPGAVLELAQASSTRSCAYLRCANLAGEGGPAAGQGAGSQRCSKCKVAWYCGTACSHADWRAGHRQMCRALGAESTFKMQPGRRGLAALARLVHGGCRESESTAPLHWLSASLRTLSGSPGAPTEIPNTQNSYILASSTPITKQLWRERYPWTEEKLLAASARDPATQQPKAPRPLVVTYPFATDDLLREHYRSPWGGVRIGRILEDLDSLSALIAFEHCDVADESSRPPLLVTAGVEAIELSSSKLDLQADMTMSGRVVWAGSSSVDIRMELEQAGQRQLTALFTFVARDMLSGKPHPISSLAPKASEDQRLFCERQRTNQRRKAAREAAKGSTSIHHGMSLKEERWAEQLLAVAKTKMDLPALADSNLLLMDDTSLENTFSCQPQTRNVHGRVFGGFLMRRAFELAHSSTYLFAGTRPQAVEVEQVTFQRPVSVGDLMRLKSWVAHTWVAPSAPTQGMAHVQVEASVTQPERRSSVVTNTFNFVFSFELERDEAGAPIAPKRVLPCNEQQALEGCCVAAKARRLFTVGHRAVELGAPIAKPISIRPAQRSPFTQRPIGSAPCRSLSSIAQAAPAANGMDPGVEETVERIHSSTVRIVVYLGGGASQAVGWLLAVPGASRTVLDMRIPYSRASMADMLGAVPQSYTSADTAQAMAQAAYRQAVKLSPFGTDVVGVGCTCALATDRVKQGEHKAFFTTYNGTQQRSFALVLAKNTRSRWGEDTVVSKVLVKAVAESMGLSTQVLELGLVSEGSGADSFQVDTKAIEIDDILRDMLNGRVNTVEFSGGNAATRLRPSMEGAFELSIGNADKGLLSLEEIKRRVSQFTASGLPLVVTQAPLFTQKADLFRQSVFVVGYDTAERLVRPEYYGTDQAMLLQFAKLRHEGCSFLVAGRRDSEGRFRTLADLVMPEMLPQGGLFEEIPASEFRADISSTELRTAAT